MWIDHQPIKRGGGERRVGAIDCGTRVSARSLHAAICGANAEKKPPLADGKRRFRLKTSFDSYDPESAPAPVAGVFWLKISLLFSTVTLTGSPSCRLPLRISSARGSSRNRSTDRRMGRAP